MPHMPNTPDLSRVQVMHTAVARIIPASGPVTSQHASKQSLCSTLLLSVHSWCKCGLKLPDTSCRTTSAVLCAAVQVPLSPLYLTPAANMAAEHEHHLQPEEGYKPYDLDVDMVEDYTPDPYDCCTEDSNSTSEYSSGMPDQSCPVKLRCSSSTYDPAACFNSRGIPHESLPVGLVIDRRFKITGLLGKGSFAAAYAAQCLETGEEEVSALHSLSWWHGLHTPSMQLPVALNAVAG